MIDRMYQPSRLARSEFTPVRNLRYHVRAWGQPAAGRPPLVLLHGWMDVSASWQFVVDAMQEDRLVLAPDWRGYGLTEGGGVDCYWMADCLADLEWLLDHYAGAHGAADLVGHSMGGNIAMQYAGVRPQRVRRLVNLEGFGMPEVAPDHAPTRYGAWIDELKRLHRGDLALAPYPAPDGVARRLMKTNPLLTRDKADWLARHWAVAQPSADDGGERWAILGDPAHKVVNAHIYRVDEALALYRAIRAPVLVVEAEQDSLQGWWKGRYTLPEFHQRLQQVQGARVETVAQAGHMLHHDQPERVAALIEAFLAPSTAP